MEHYDDHHWHWWHWLIIIVVVFLALGIGYTLIQNYEIVKKNDQSYVNGVERAVEHPINTTENVVNNLTNK